MKSCNIKVTSQISFCSYALSFDLYKGCPHNCAYCFAQTEHGERLNVSAKEIVELFSFNKIIRYVNKDTKLKVGYIYDLINKKQPLHIGGMADPFPYKIENETKHALNFIKQIGKYPCIWSTKNPPGRYLTELEKGNHIIQFSCIGFKEYDERIRKIEPGLPDIHVRLKNLKRVKKGVKKVIVRLQPFIPFIWTYDNLNRFFDYFSNIADAISIEFLKKPVGEKWVKFSKIIQFDVCKFFENCPTMDMGSDKVFATVYRYEMLKLLKKMIKERGMEFYSAENYFRHMSDGPSCCGISEKDDPIFQTKLNYCLNSMLFKAKKEGSFCWDDIDNELPGLLKKGKWVMGFDHALAKLKIETILKYRFQHENKLSPSSIFANLKPKYIKGKLHYVYEEKTFDTGFDLLTNFYLEQYDKDYGNSILKDAKVI